MKLGFFSVAMLLAANVKGIMLERPPMEAEIFDLAQVSSDSFQPETLAQALSESSKNCDGGRCPSLRNDMTHIAVTTANNQQVTIDMPMQETKRITVKQNMMVVEDKQITDLPPVQDEPAKPVVKPVGVQKPCSHDVAEGSESSSSESEVEAAPVKPKGKAAPKASPAKVEKKKTAAPETKDAQGSESSSSSSSSSDSESEGDDATQATKAAPAQAKQPAAKAASKPVVKADEQKDSDKESSASSSEDEAELKHIIGDASTKMEAMQFASDHFATLTKDKEGKVKAAEIFKLIEADKHNEIDPKLHTEAQKLVKAIDEDGDGKVT